METQDQKHKLLKQASSHGPYLWSSADVQNALLWFRPLHAADKTLVDADDNMETKGADTEGRDFLRRLLHSPGIHAARIKKRHKRDGGNSDGHTSAASAGAGKKRKREQNEGSKNVRSDDILSSVLKGYYQLYSYREAAASDDSSSQMKSNHDDTNSINNDSDDNRGIGLSNAEMTSFQLQQDLNSIILSRIRTQELYKAAIRHTNQKHGSTTKIPKGLQMNILIDEYTTHPDTAILRAYTSSLYDRYTSLPSNDKEKLINKMLLSSKLNVRTQQVVLLLLLEPLRRLYVQRLQTSMEKVAHQKNSKSTESQCYTSEQLASKMSLYPLLTSDTIFSDISYQQIEQECTREPMQQIVEFIMQSVPSAEEVNKTHEIDICWWSLPSPLLCFISQLYFPIACGYIRHWIKVAIREHDKLYALDNIHTGKPHALLKDSSSTDSFGSVMLRIQHFSQTSQRLETLTSYVMSIVEEDYQLAVEKYTPGLDDGESMTDDAAFRMKLAWNAVRRSLKSDDTYD